MRVLVVNVNTTESITQAVAAPGTEIVGLTPFSVPIPSRAILKATWQLSQ